MAKAKTNSDEKQTNVDFDLFAALAAIDAKDYDYFSRLTTEQQRKFVPYMMLMWTSAVQAGQDLGDYYLRSTDLAANKYYFHEAITDHPQLQWQMLCAASPGMGKQRHQWIPHLSAKKSNLQESLSAREAREYFEKAGLNPSDAEDYSQYQRRAVKLGEQIGRLNADDLMLLAQIITDEELENYLREIGQ